MSHLLGTKLHQPAPPPQRVRRPHLVQRLNQGLAAGRRLTLVSAPAGFGKTTCVSAWLHALDGWPVAWLSLDPADDDPGRFFTYFFAALQQAHPGLGRELAGVLHAGQLPPGPVISTTLVNDLLELQGRLLLVLDDFQVIQDPLILDVLEQLLTNLPPSLHLVLITREDPPLPLARMRAHNQLTEVRARDLRFTRSDAAAFLNDVMHLSLAPADVDVLETKTEGWIAGLQLAALAVRDRADPSHFIGNLSGSHRFILSYLTDQVLDRQPPEIRQFLLRTAILDQLNGDLCNAVTGRSDSHALLEQLFSANLFLIPLDDEGQWYRYHHLFADLLRGLQSALDRDEITALHRRAGHWYARAGGQQGAFVSAAIHHALAAQDYEIAVDLLERHAMGLIMQGYAKTLNSWVQAIPQPWEAASPRTDLAFAWMHLLRGAYAQAAPHLDRVQDTLARSPRAPLPEGDRSSLQAEWLVMQALLLNMQGQAAESMALADQALELVPATDRRVRSLAHYALAGACQISADYSNAVAAYQMAIQHGRAAENLVAEMMSTAGLALLAFERGQLHLAFEITAPVAERAEQSASLPPISGVVDGLLGQVYYQWYQLEPARHYFRRALQFSTLGGYQSGLISCHVLLSRLSLLEGELEAAAREIQRAVDLLQLETPTDIRQEVVAQQVCVSLALDRPAAARLALQGQGFSFQDGFSFPQLPPGPNVPHALGLLYNSSLRVLLHQARAGRHPASLEPGIHLAGRLIDRALAGQYLLVALQALLLRARMYAELEHSQPLPDASQAGYIRALELAQPEGFIAVFVEHGPPVARALVDLLRQDHLGTVQSAYVQRILSAFSESRSPTPAPGELDPSPAAPHGPQPPSPAPHGPQPSSLAPRGPQPSPPAPRGPQSASPDQPTLVEPLTGRELDVLRLMAQGLKYKEIAARLYISLNTVRFHVKGIYGKLDVNNRTQAIQAARQHRIL